MKAIAIALLLALVIPPVANAETELIAGGAAGYIFNGPASGEPVFTAIGGMRVKTFNEGATKLYTVGRYNGTELDAQWGAKAILANRINNAGAFWWLIDGGILDDGFTNADSTQEITPSFGAGVAFAPNKYTSITLYFETWRATGEEWSQVIWLTTEAHIFEF